MKNYKLSEIDKFNFDLGEYQEKDIEKAVNLSNEVSKFFPSEVCFTTSLQDEKEYFEHTFVRLIHPEMFISISYDDYRKKYNIYLREYFHDLSTHQNSEIERSFEKPRNIGVLNAKKITDWVNYWESVYEACTNLRKANNSKETAFLKELENSGLEIRWDRNKKSGEIVKNGIEYSFSIQNGRISQKISINYKVDNDLKSFIALSTNNYIA